MRGARGALAAALALVSFAAPDASFPATPAEQERLQALRARIERLRSELAESEEDRSEARNELRESEHAISEANRAMRELARERTAAQGERRMFSAARERTRASAEQRERELGRLLAAVYMAGEPATLKLILAGADPGQTARELTYLSYLSRAHATLLASLRADLQRLEDLDARAKASVEDLERIERERRKAREELVKQRAARRGVLERVSLKIRQQRRQVESLSRDETRLTRLLEALSRPLPEQKGGTARPESTPGAFAALKGRLGLPLQGQLVHRFGATRANGGPPWKGVFIRAPAGAEVHAVADGQVVYADWMRGYGNIVIVDHGEGYLTVYANNESVLKSIGDRVRAKETIATVGASGGGQETGLYFEARHEGKAFDPMTWSALR